MGGTPSPGPYPFLELDIFSALAPGAGIVMNAGANVHSGFRSATAPAYFLPGSVELRARSATAAGPATQKWEEALGSLSAMDLPRFGGTPS